MWRYMLCVCGFFSNLDFVFGSIVQWNDSTFDSLPPLYGLDEWSQCRRPGDVYCMVDAVLTSREESPLLTMLQEYSKQSLKHYNRTMIHRGVCVTRCGRDNESAGWHLEAEACINETVLPYGLEAKVMSVGWCQSEHVAEGTSSARALAVLCTVLAALACLATGLHILGDKCAKVDGNKYLLAFSLKRNWEILTYDRSKPRSDDRMKDVACVEGIRVLGMQCVIFSHVMLIYIYSYIDNPQFVEKMYDQFGWQAVLNSPVWLQAFFSLSGFLTAYATLLSSSTNPITLWKCLLSILNRWVRLTPVAVFALWFTIAWFPVLGNGPQWGWLVGREAADCTERWWYHVLYVHNHLPTGKFCMGHTWYLAADMQLHIVGVFLLLLLVRWRAAVVPVLTALVVASAAGAGLVVYCLRLMPIVTAQSPETLRTMFLGSQTLSLVYLPAWANLPGYLGGLTTAFLLHHNQVKGTVKLHEQKWFNTVFHLALPAGSAVVLAGAVFLQDHSPPQWSSAVYAALDRTLVAVCFNVFLLGCFSKCKSGLRQMFEWRGFHTLGRLSYCVFLIHFIVLRLTLASNTQLGHASILALICLLITSSVLSYLAAVPLCLLVELPSIQLWKALTDREVTVPRPPITEPEEKPCDLVATVRRSEV